MNQQALAKHFGVSATTVGQWVHKGVPHTRTKKGTYLFDPKAVKAWHAQTMRPQPSAAAPSYGAIRARKETALADLREFEVRKRKGELVTRESVRTATFAVIRKARDQFFNMPDRHAGLLAAETDQHKIHTMLTKEIHQILQELSHDQSPAPSIE